MIFRHAEKEESKDIIELAKKVFKPNMGKQFIRLFSPLNHEHQWIAEDEGKIVAAVNYYHTWVDTSIGTLSVSSIGAVCTDEAYRGQGISSKLLHLAQERMLHEQTDFCIISGDGPLYQRFGARDLGAMSRYIIKNERNDHEFTIEKFTDDPKILYPIFKKESIKYQRSLDEFSDLFVAQTYPDNYQNYPVYVIYHKNEIISYIILVNHPKAKLLSVKEFAGDRKAIIQCLPDLREIYKKEGIEITVTIHDPIKDLIQDKEEMITQHATIKVIDEMSFLSKINQFCDENNYAMNIERKDEDYILNLNHSKYALNQEQLFLMIFSGQYPKHISHSIMHHIFPIELPWSHNLNYQ